MANNHTTRTSDSSLNTLAQNGTGFHEKGSIFLNGTGTEIRDIKSLKGRAKRKVITQSMILSLIDVSEKRNSLERKKSYWNSFHCQNKLLTANGKVYGKFCKNRCCTLCCCIRKAIIINKYLPVLQLWEHPYFVTLTVKAVPAYRLQKVVKALIRGFKRINQKIRKRHLRGRGLKLKGIKSLECNFNPTKKTYNPHFHLIVENKEMADLLIQEWMKLWTSRWTNKAAQHSQPVTNRESALIEIIKYGSKIFTEADVIKKSKEKGRHRMHVAALDNIFIAMKGSRIFDRFGFNLPTISKSPLKTELVHNYDSWEFQPKCWDWVNSNNESLTGYIPVYELIDLLQNNIETTLE